MGSLFSKGAETPKTTVVGVDAGGITAGLNKRASGGVFGKKSKAIGVETSAERQGLVGDIAATFPEQAAILGDLRARLAPGISDLRSSRIAALEGNRRRTLGNLRENLSRRKVLGSSFAQDTLARADLEFQRERDRIEAETTLAEIEGTQRLAQAEFAAKRAEFETFLNELNTQLQVGTQLATQATAEFNANARLGAELETAAGMQFFDNLLDVAGSAAGFALG
jgi:hypothetical protein